MKHQPLILESGLSRTPIYYLAFAYKLRERNGNKCVEVTGKKWDITEQITRLIRPMRIEGLKDAAKYVCQACEGADVFGDALKPIPVRQDEGWYHMPTKKFADKGCGRQLCAAGLIWERIAIAEKAYDSGM